jgi:hypothetical protein
MKIICIGRNYGSYRRIKNERPAEPVFIKPDSAILLKQHPLLYRVLRIFIMRSNLFKINKVGVHRT